MSWQAYIDRMAQSKVDMSGIYGKNGAPWACSANFNPGPDEIACLVDAIKNNDPSIFASGVRLSGKRWTVIRMDKEFDVLVLKGKDCDNCKQNLIAAASNQAIILGANVDENVTAGTVRVSVEGLRDYLKSNNY